MVRSLLTAATIFLTGLAALPAQADVNGDLNGFFGSLGYSGNVSQAQAYLDAVTVPERRLRRHRCVSGGVQHD